MAPNKYAHIERERRYLVSDPPAEISSATDFLRIVDLYIAGTRLRLRRHEDKNGQVVSRKLGQKFMPQANQSDATMMTNFYLDESEYKVLSTLTGTSLTKRRYSHEYSQCRFSIDVFEGALEGLVLCETEIEETETVAVQLPSFAKREVTSDQFFTGGSLARVTSHELAERLRNECRE